MGRSGILCGRCVGAYRTSQGLARTDERFFFFSVSLGAEASAVGSAARREFDAGRPLRRAGLKVLGVAVAARSAATIVKDCGRAESGSSEGREEVEELHFGWILGN